MSAAYRGGMSTTPGLSYILAASALVFALFALRHLSDRDRRRFRWQFTSDLVRDGGIALLFGTMAVLFARVVPAIAGVTLTMAVLVSWLVSSTYLSRRAGDEGRAHVEAILSGKYDSLPPRRF